MTGFSADLRSAHKKFLKYLKEQGRSSATILAYGSDLDQLINFCQKNKKIKASQINSEDLNQFKKQLSQENYTPKSVSRKINSLKTFFKFLSKEKVINQNPSLNISHPHYESKAPRILTKTEYRALRDACRQDLRMYAIVEFFLQTGIRIAELANLKVDDFKNNLLHITAYGSQQSREIPLNPSVKMAVDNYLKIRPQSKAKILFLTKTGKPFLVRNIRGAVNRYFKIAGIREATVNDLRHTFINHQLRGGAPLVLISKIVGHKRLSTTEKYLKLIKEKNPPKMKLKEL